MSPGGPLRAVARAVREQRDAYDHAHSQPMAGYAALIGGYTAATGGIILALHRSGTRLPRRIPAVDIVLGGLAVHKAGRLLAKDAVTSPVRAPFTEFDGPAGPAEVSEDVRGEGLRHAVGELVSCPFCLAPWLGGAYVAGLVAAPRVTRTLAALFAVVGVSDLVQQGYGQLMSD